MAVPFAALQMSFSERWGGGGRGESRVFSPLCDPSAQGLVLSKLCQPCNDLQQRTVSLLIGRPSPWPPPPPPPPLCLGIPLPRRLPDLPCLHLSHPPPPPQLTTHAPHPANPSIASAPALCPRSPCAAAAAAVSSAGDSLSGAACHLSPGPDWQGDLRDYQLLSEWRVEGWGG